MRNKTIAVDICNTLADIVGEIEIRLGKSPTPNNYFHPALKGKDDFFIKNLDIFLDAKVLGNSNEVISELAKYNKIVYITARPEVSKLVTKIWLRNNGYPTGPIYFTNNKPKIAKKLGVDIAFEDAPHEIEKYHTFSKGIEVMVKRQSYNMGYRNLFEWEDISLEKQVQVDKNS